MLRFFYSPSTIKRLFIEAQKTFPETENKIKLRILPTCYPLISKYVKSQRIGLIHIFTILLMILSICFLFLPYPLNLMDIVLINVLSLPLYISLYYEVTNKDEFRHILLFPMILPVMNARYVMYHEFSHVALNHLGGKGNEFTQEREASKMANERMRVNKVIKCQR